MGASLEEYSSISLESHSFITTGKENSDSEDEIIIKKKLTRKAFIVSDDDNDDNDNSKNDGEFVKRPELPTSVGQVGQNLDSDEYEGILETSKRRKRVLMQDEDESDVDDPLPLSQNGSESIETQSVSKQKALSDVNKDNLVTTQKRLALFQDSSLYDAESSDEETVQSFSNNKQNLGPSCENNLKGATKKKEVHSNKPKSSTKTTKEQSAKSNKNEIHKIHSESQRMLRETRLSLPYHRPRQRTLTEFLQRRKTIPNIPKSLRPTEEQMIEICKHLEEREKETKEFFKSESEESDTEDKSESRDKETTCNNSREKISSSQSSELNGPLKDSGIQSFSQALFRESEQEDTVTVSCGIVEELNTAAVTDGDNSLLTLIHKPSLKNIDDICGTMNVVKISPTLDLNKPLSKNYCASELVEEMEVAHVSETTTIIKSRVSSENLGIETDSQDFILHLTDDDDDDDNYDNDITSSVKCEPSKTESKPFKVGLNDNRVNLNDSENTLPILSTGLFNDSNRSNEEGAKCNIESSTEAGHLFKLRLFENMNCESVTKGQDKCMKSELIMTKELVLKMSESQELNKIALSNVEDAVNDSNIFSVVESEDLVLKFSESQNMSDATKATKEKDDHDSTNKNTDKVDSALKSIKDKSSKSSNNKGSEKDLCLASYLKDNLLNKSVDDSKDEELEYNKMPATLKKSLAISGSFPDIKPKLSRGPNNLIDLEVVPTPGGVKSLIQRFFEHSTAKKKPPAQKRQVELGIVSAEKGSEGIESVVKDTVTVILGEDELSSAGEKPGTKMLRLRKDLQQQISKRKSEEWSRRLQEAQLDNENVPTGELSDCGILDEEEEAEMTETEEEEEEEEEDMLITDSKRLKSAFIEDEAELSDEGEAADVSSDEEEDDQEETEKVEEQDIYDKDENTNEETVSQRVTDEDSTTQPIKNNSQRKRFQRVKTFDMFSSDDSDVDLGIDDTCPIPPYQPQRNVTSERAPPESVEKTSFSFLSPVISLPGGALQSWSSVKSGGVSPMTPNGMKTFRDRTKLQLTQKKLFTEPDSQDNLNEFMGLSREFTDMNGKKVSTLVNTTDPIDSDSELLGLCSGQFVSQTVDLASLEEEDERDANFARILNTQSNSQMEDSQDKFRLNLSNDFLSPVKMVQELTALVQPSRESSPNTFLKMVSTDEEEISIFKAVESSFRPKKKTKKFNKMLEFSDEESDDSGSSNSEHSNSINLVEYDSEENEVHISADKSRLATDFFEEEAELSESDWGSEDEDEKGLDQLEPEDGDVEQLDQTQLKEQLDRIHMRRILDDDQREVRLLQELLLKDGELHSEGGGRERKFRWKNIDGLEETGPREDSGDEGLYEAEEEEDEEQWRRMRHEREKFLKEQKAKAGIMEEKESVLEEDSQLMKLGVAALRRIQTTHSQDMTRDTKKTKNTVVRTMSEPIVPVSPDLKRPFQLLTKRGSFLARGETALARLAELSRGSAETNVSGPKNSRNFVFATISPVKEVRVKEADKVKIVKRKSMETTPQIKKKLRLSDNNVKGCRLFDHLIT